MRKIPCIQLPRIPCTAFISPLAGLAVCIAIIFCCGKTPASALVTLFTGTFTSAYYFGSMLNTAAFLMTAGAGAAIAIKSGNMNLGGEGQIYAGGFVAAAILALLLEILLRITVFRRIP